MSAPASSEPTTVAYKVLTGDQMAQFQADKIFAGAPIDLVDGYIHLSTAQQLDETVTKHFAGQQGLQIAAVDLASLGDAVKWERSRGGELFPHVYGALPLSAITAHSPLTQGADGEVNLPTAG